MSLTIQQIITDAKRLAGRLKERDVIADNLLTETHAINKKIDAMKQFQEEVEQLNLVANQKPHAQLIADIRKENFRDIQQENRELRAALEEHQTTLEHIMSKYREHTSQQIYHTRVNYQVVHDERCYDIIRKQADRIDEMAEVIYTAAQIDDGSGCKDGETIARLRTENKGLREMLKIAQQHGTLNGSSTEDKTVQTENAM